MVRIAFFFDSAWLIPALPALAAAIIALFGMKTPEKGGWIAVVLVGLAGALCLGVTYDFFTSADKPTFDNPVDDMRFNWFSTGSASVDFGVYLDPLTVFMLFTVGILVTLITLYSTAYMHEEGPGRRRYYAELTLFITGMLGMVVANNLLMAFVFWEIMGLCSYLLIGYWYRKPAAASAAKKAFLTTRVGDAFLLVGLGILLMEFGTLEYGPLFEAAAGGLEAAGVDHTTVLIANLCIFAGAVGKSAQFPLHVWLPDAMEGPTTVSALIHAATMVKAGVYLVARSFPLFALTPEIFVVVAIVGGFTALFAASLALTNWDLKRVLAYSTLSQLGYMFLGLGVAGVIFVAKGPTASLIALGMTGLTVAIFHLFSHAFFKAGLFLSAGSVGHAFHGVANPYDMRIMGGMRKFMPITAFAMLMGTISIAGIPPFSGFYSKDALLHEVFLAASQSGAILYWILYAMAVLTAAMTAYYMFRLYFLTFEGRHRGPEWARERGIAQEEPTHDVGMPSIAHAHHGEHHEEHVESHPHEEEHGHGHHGTPHESPWGMTVPLAILGVFAIVGGALALAFAGGSFAGMIYPAHHTVEAAIESTGAAGVTVDMVEGEHHAHEGLVYALTHPFLEVTTYVSIAAAAIGIGLAWSLWSPSKVEDNIVKHSTRSTQGVYRVWGNRYYIDAVYDRIFGRAVLRQAESQNRFDAEVVDGAVNGVARVNVWSGSWLRRMNTGNVQDYALTMLGGLVLVMIIAIYVPQIPTFVETVRGWLGYAFGGA